MRLNALLLAKMNKYLVYIWSPLRRLYEPFESFYTLFAAKSCSRSLNTLCGVSAIVLRNPHPRYDFDS